MKKNIGTTTVMKDTLTGSPWRTVSSRRRLQPRDREAASTPYQLME